MLLITNPRPTGLYPAALQHGSCFIKREAVLPMCRLVGCVGWQVLKVLKGHTNIVLAVAISTDGAKIVSGSVDNTVRVWSAETGEVSAACLVA